MEEPTCLTCKAMPSAELKVTRCPICYRYVCDGCIVTRGGRPFCSTNCADFYFFGDEEL